MRYNTRCKDTGQLIHKTDFWEQIYLSIKDLKKRTFSKSIYVYRTKYFSSILFRRLNTSCLK